MKSNNRSRYSPTLPVTCSESAGSYFPFGLRNIKDVGRAEPDQYSLVLSADVFLGLRHPSCAPNSDQRSEDADSPLSLLDLAAKLVPRIQPRYSLSVRPLSGDLQDVPKAVIVESSHRREVDGKDFGVSLLQLLDKGLDVGRDSFLRGLLFLLLLLFKVLGERGDIGSWC